MRTPDQLIDLVHESERAISAVKSACTLIRSTYGAGCTDQCGQLDHDVEAAAKTIIVHLTLLKNRAAAMALIDSAPEQVKTSLLGMLR